MQTSLVTIGSYTNVFEAEIAKSFLEDAGFEVFLQNERIMSMYASIAGDMYQVQLQVDSEKESEAKKLLQDLDDSYVTNEALKKESALIEGHFCLTSGKHSNRYIEKIRVIQNPETVSILCSRLAQRLERYEFDTVVGPAYGGIVLAFEVARRMNKKFIFTQRKDDKMSIRSGFDLVEVREAVVIEDILSTGGSIKEVIQCLNDNRIKVKAIGLLVDRSAGAIDLGIPIESLLSIDIPAWNQDECELCKLEIPIHKPGSSDKKQ